VPPTMSELINEGKGSEKLTMSDIQKFRQKRYPAGAMVEGVLVTDENLVSVKGWLGVVWDRIEPTVGKYIFIDGDRRGAHQVRELEPSQFESKFEPAYSRTNSTKEGEK